MTRKIKNIGINDSYTTTTILSSNGKITKDPIYGRWHCLLTKMDRYNWTTDDDLIISRTKYENYLYNNNLDKLVPTCLTSYIGDTNIDISYVAFLEKEHCRFFNCLTYTQRDGLPAWVTKRGNTYEAQYKVFKDGNITRVYSSHDTPTEGHLTVLKSKLESCRNMKEYYSLYTHNVNVFNKVIDSLEKLIMGEELLVF